MEPQIGKYYLSGHGFHDLVFYCYQVNPYALALVLNRHSYKKPIYSKVRLTLQDRLIEIKDSKEIKRLDKKRLLMKLID